MKRSMDSDVADEPPAKRARIQSSGPRKSRFDEMLSSRAAASSNAESEEEEDPLDAFMKQNDAKTKKQTKAALRKQRELEKSEADPDESKQNATKSKRGNKKSNEIDDYDPLDAFNDQMRSNPDSYLLVPSRRGGDDNGMDSDEEVRRMDKYVNKREQLRQDPGNKQLRAELLQYDEYGNMITPDKDRIIEHLPPVDWTRCYVRPFKKNFYKEHEQVAGMTDAQLKGLLGKFDVRIVGSNAPKPVVSFAHFGFDEKLMDTIIDQKFSQPTPIQCQAIPCIMSGRDVLGLAKTGSGKTGAFLWPAIAHISAQERVTPGEGPIAIIVSPTRELAEQIYLEAVKYVQKPFGIRVYPLYGGTQMHQQKRELAKGVEMIIATPGRLIDMLSKKNNNNNNNNNNNSSSNSNSSNNSKDAAATNCFRTTYLVIDEADRMFNLGFESQIRSIVGQIRPERQVCLFSATMNKKVEMLARDILNDFIKIEIGDIHIGNKDVQQIINVVKTEDAKWEWLQSRLRSFVSSGLVLIFCSSKNGVEQLKRKIINEGKLPCKTMHGDKLQKDREKVIKEFKDQKFKVLVTTDVAQRGLDIHQIKTVVNYDCAWNMDSHIQRIGRTGRAGDKDGIAYTLLTPRGRHDREMAPQLVEAFEKLGMPVTQELKALAGMGTNGADLNAKILAEEGAKSHGILKHNNGAGGAAEGGGKRKDHKHVHFRSDKRKEFGKNGFKVGNASSFAKSFQNTFTKGKQLSEEMGSMQTEKPKRKSRWNDKK